MMTVQYGIPVKQFKKCFTVDYMQEMLHRQTANKKCFTVDLTPKLFHRYPAAECKDACKNVSPLDMMFHR